MSINGVGTSTVSSNYSYVLVVEYTVLATVSTVLGCFTVCMSTRVSTRNENAMASLSNAVQGLWECHIIIVQGTSTTCYESSSSTIVVEVQVLFPVAVHLCSVTRRCLSYTYTSITKFELRTEVKTKNQRN
jgi:hypothetical protein